MVGHLTSMHLDAGFDSQQHYFGGVQLFHIHAQPETVLVTYLLDLLLGCLAPEAPDLSSSLFESQQHGAS